MNGHLYKKERQGQTKKSHDLVRFAQFAWESIESAWRYKHFAASAAVFAFAILRRRSERTPWQLKNNSLAARQL
jgi:hypothetical protein